MEQYLADYLGKIEMAGDYPATKRACEVCNFRETATIREVVTIAKETFGKLPVVACKNCGFLFQEDQFVKEFYSDFYSKHYRNVIKGDPKPDDNFIQDQRKRGKLLYDFMKQYFDGPGGVLDVGCSIGTMLEPFIENGWQAYGTDPDEGYASYGRNTLGLPVEAIVSEEMVLDNAAYDFIFIMGSLEHVYDPNLVLSLCRKASKEGAFLLLEGRGYPQNETKYYFNHNHHRYFSKTSFELMMIKHGWEPLLSTDEEICGSTRAGGIFCLGRACPVPTEEEFLAIINNGKKENPIDLLNFFDRHDKKCTGTK